MKSRSHLSQSVKKQHHNPKPSLSLLSHTLSSATEAACLVLDKDPRQHFGAVGSLIFCYCWQQLTGERLQG